MRPRALIVAVFFALLSMLIEGCGVTDCPETCCRVRYLDDMEDVGLRESSPVMGVAWVPASVPPGYRWEDDRRIWWCTKDREVRAKDLFPGAQPGPGEDFIPVLEINFRGARYPGKGYDPQGQWSGLMRLTAPAGRDYSDLSYFEMWLRRTQGSGGKMHVDLGEISENFYNPWVVDSLHTEDRNGDGELDPETENTGLDGVFTGHPGDDPWDDWYYREGDYSRINGTERNPHTIPDTEDLDDNGLLDIENTHFRLAFDLDERAYIARKTGDWRLYRIPLEEAEAHGGSPDWSAVRYIRFFFTETDSPAVYQIAYLRLAGSTWENEGVRGFWGMSPVTRQTEEIFTVGAKNFWDDPDYVPPYDPGADPQGFTLREQSMVLALTAEASWHCGAAHRRLAEPVDISEYDALSFYVHGDDYPALIAPYTFVRWGKDSLNFYEYGVRVLPGWNGFRVAFSDLRAVERHTPQERTIYGSPVSFRGTETSVGWIWIYGEPTLEEVSWLGAGLTLGSTGAPGLTPIEVWLDDLRATAE